MAKIFNEQIIEYLRNNAKKCKFDPTKYEQGETFIVKQPGGKRGEKVFVSKTEENDGEDQVPAEAYNADPPIMVEPTTEPHPECEIHEEEDAAECFPAESESSSESESTIIKDKLKGGGDARRGRNICADMTPSQIASFCAKCCYGSSTSPIRSILGPFPDEPVISAIDKLLTIVGLTLGAKSDELGEFDEDCIDLSTDEDFEDEDEDCD